MNIGEYIKEEIKNQGRTQKWVAEKIEMDVNTFNRKINNDTFAADELIKIAKILNIDLNKLKEEL
ncbi:MAG: helix-turn-helix domain-containing protein [Bacillota bacterium]|nr:helix-turn-helix domain-containing protein [Bacillota bacterium]